MTGRVSNDSDCGFIETQYHWLLELGKPREHLSTTDIQSTFERGIVYI
jgi:hypothetical protein